MTGPSSLPSGAMRTPASPKLATARPPIGGDGRKACVRDLSTLQTVCHSCRGSCSAHPGRGNCVGVGSAASATMWPRKSTAMARIRPVPTSRPASKGASLLAVEPGKQLASDGAKGQSAHNITLGDEGDNHRRNHNRHSPYTHEPELHAARIDSACDM